jgi:hypothetical protein
VIQKSTAIIIFHLRSEARLPCLGEILYRLTI